MVKEECLGPPYVGKGSRWRTFCDALASELQHGNVRHDCLFQCRTDCSAHAAMILSANPVPRTMVSNSSALSIVSDILNKSSIFSSVWIV